MADGATPDADARILVTSAKMYTRRVLVNSIIYNFYSDLLFAGGILKYPVR